MIRVYYAFCVNGSYVLTKHLLEYCVERVRWEFELLAADKDLIQQANCNATFSFRVVFFHLLVELVFLEVELRQEESTSEFSIRYQVLVLRVQLLHKLHLFLFDEYHPAFLKRLFEVLPTEASRSLRVFLKQLLL